MKTILCFITVLSAFNVQAQLKDDAKLSPAAKYIFRFANTKLTVTEKNFFAKDYVLKIRKESNDTALFSKADEANPNAAKDFEPDNEETAPVYIEIYPTDLNNDGVEEIFERVSGGMAGPEIQDFDLYIKDENGKYIMQEGVNAPAFLARSTSINNYPDLIGAAGGGPGFDNLVPTKFDVFKWNGKKYILFKKDQPHLKTDKEIKLDMGQPGSQTLPLNI